MKERIEIEAPVKHFRPVTREKTDLKEKALTPLSVTEMESIGRAEYQERWLKPALAAVSNKNLFSETARAMEARLRKDIDALGSGIFIAEIENKLIRLTLNLTPADRRIVIDNFVRNFSKYCQEKNLLSPETVNSLNPKVPGIENVIQYILGRRREIPGKRQQFFYNSELDANYKIDLLELIYQTSESGELLIDEMNLVQNKSTVRSGDIEATQAAHQEWINNVWADLALVRQVELSGVEDLELRLDVIDDQLIDLLKRLEDQSELDMTNDFFKKIMPETVKEKKQQTALLYLRGEKILEKIDEFKALFSSDPKYKNLIATLIKQVRQELASRTRELRNISSPKIIHSQIAVGNKIIAEREYQLDRAVKY